MGKTNTYCSCCGQKMPAGEDTPATGGADITLNESILQQFVDALSANNKIAQLMSRELWDANDCALYFRCAKNTVLNKYSRSSSWPRAVGGGEMKPMWLSKEVRTWAKRRSA